MADENQEVIQIPEPLREILDEAFGPYFGRVQENLDRVFALIKIGLLSPEQRALRVVLNPEEGEGEVRGFDDVLRSAVVFMHATIDDVLRTMAIRNLSQPQWKSRTYNTISDIKKLLSAMGIEVPPYESYFSTIKSMLKRRHQIVHNGDRRGPPGMRNPPIDSIDPLVVRDWYIATNGFLSDLINAVGAKQATEDMRSRGMLKE